MIKPAELDLTIYQGATFRKKLQWYTPSPTDTQIKIPRNLTGCTARMQIRPTISSEEVLLEMTTENGRLILSDPVSGLFEMFISDEDTAALNFKVGVYDIEFVVPSGDVERPIKGNVTLDPEVTRIPTN